MTKARDLANIISGGFDATDIPNLDTAKITSGTFADARLPATALNSNVDLTTLSASNLTSGTVATARLGSGTANSSTFLRGDGSFATPAGGTNTPAFEATRSSNQTITHDTMTKIATNVEVFDTDGCYDHSTNYRFLPTTAGKYYVYTQATASIGIEQLNRYSLLIRKNGNNYKVSSKYFNNNPARIITSFIGAVIDFNGSSDYVEFFTKIEYASSGTIEINGDSTELTFGGYRILT